MNILIAPDSFKGTLDSKRVCRIIRYSAKRSFPDCIIKEMPLADGGEGTCALMVDALRGTLEETVVEGPFSKPVRVKIGFVDKGTTAIIESAAAIGLPLAGRRANPEKTSTYGVGQMISYAVDRGAKKIYLALGGSSTNDLGCGMLSAMGVQFLDIKGNHFTPVGGNMLRIEAISYNQEFSKYRGIEFVVMCDVDNPLLGEKGAAAVFAPQKGASTDAVMRLERGAEKLSLIIGNETGKRMEEKAGAGAAGGLGYAAMTFLDAKRISGIDAILDMYSFEESAMRADIIITGEGKLDSQSFMGKAVGGVLKRSNGKKVVIFCGDHDGCKLPESAEKVSVSEGVGCEYAMLNAAECLQNAADRYFESIK